MNKKGFTLIELLAVIVILAVIALIATPIIMNAISSAKQGAWKDAAYGIVKATENVYAKNFSELTNQVDTFFLYENGVMTSYPSGKTIDYKGSKPQDGGIVLHSDGTITLAIYDGVNCAVKSRTSSDVTLSTTDKATCISNIYYKQSSAPFSNLVINSSFTDVSNWFGTGATLSVSSNTLILTGTGAGNGLLAYQTTSIPVYNGQKFYISFNTKVTNSDALSIQYFIDGTTGGFSNQLVVNSPVKNVSYEKSHVFSLDSTFSGNFKFRVISGYLDKPTTIGKTMEVKDPIVIDLSSSFGLGNEPTKDQMDNNLNKVWIDSATNTPKRFTTGGWVGF